MNEKEVVINFKVGENMPKQVDNIEQLTNAMKELNGTVNKLIEENKKATDSVEKIGDEAEKTTQKTSLLSRGLGAVGNGFKALGTAIKGLGIGAAIAVFALLVETFKSNQKVVDAFNIVLGTLQNIFSQVTNVIVSVIEKVSASTNGFKSLQAVIGGLITLQLTPLKAIFFALKLVIDEVRLAWEESPFGNKDQAVIKQLNTRIEETKNTLVEIKDDAIQAGKDVANNYGGMINELGQVVEGTIDGVSKISVKSAFELSKTQVALQNTAELAAAEQQILVEKYDRQAEKLRQIRDDDRLSIAERIKANNELKDVLDEQEKAMLAVADAQIAAARATVAQNNSIENRKALLDAIANKEGVLAQIEGLRSEQKGNANALDNESKALTNSKLQAETELAIKQKEFEASREKDVLKRLELEKKVLEDSKKAELDRIQTVIDATNAGTQARADAEAEKARITQEYNNQILANTDQFNAEKERLDKERRDKEIEGEKFVADTKAAIQQASLDNVSGAIGILSTLAGENKQLQKAALIGENAVGIARTIINTQASNAATTAQGAALAIPTAGASVAAAAALVAKNNIAAGISIAASIAATVKGLKGLGTGGSVGGGNNPGGGGMGPTNINLAPKPFDPTAGLRQASEASRTNQTQTITPTKEPIVKAYVVSSDMSSQQEKDKKLNALSRL